MIGDVVMHSIRTVPSPLNLVPWFTPMELDSPHTKDFSRTSENLFEVNLLPLSVSLWFMVHMNLLSLWCPFGYRLFRKMNLVCKGF